MVTKRKVKKVTKKSVPVITLRDKAINSLYDQLTELEDRKCTLDDEQRELDDAIDSLNDAINILEDMG